MGGGIFDVPIIYAANLYEALLLYLVFVHFLPSAVPGELHQATCRTTKNGLKYRERVVL